MSETKTTAKFSFKDSLDQRLSKTFADIDPSVADADMQALANGLVTNGQIYPVVPVEAVKIEKITTTTTEVPLSYRGAKQKTVRKEGADAPPLFYPNPQNAKI